MDTSIQGSVRRQAARVVALAAKYNTHPLNIVRELNLGGFYAEMARVVWDDGQTVPMTRLAAQITADEMTQDGHAARVVLI